MRDLPLIARYLESIDVSHVSFKKITKTGTSQNAQSNALYAIWYR